MPKNTIIYSGKIKNCIRHVWENYRNSHKNWRIIEHPEILQSSLKKYSLRILALASVAQLVGILSYNQKVARFDSQSGHIAKLWVQFPIWVQAIPNPGICDPQSKHIWEATHQCCFLTLMFLPLPVSFSHFL